MDWLCSLLPLSLLTCGVLVLFFIRSLRNARVNCENLFEEVPVELKMSALTKAILPDIVGQQRQEDVCSGTLAA